MNAGPGQGPSATVAQGLPPSTGNNNNSNIKISTPTGAGPVGPHAAVPGAGPAPIIPSPAQRLDSIDEQVWLQIGSLAESMGEFDRAMNSYESALRHNYQSINALNLIAELYRSRENFPKVRLLAEPNTHNKQTNKKYLYEPRVFLSTSRLKKGGAGALVSFTTDNAEDISLFFFLHTTRDSLPYIFF
jgi:tetratricopeptide (TPR) repeat protein